MSDYFDHIGREMRSAVRRRRHLPWYRRAIATRRSRGLAVIFAALVIATPAVAAVTGVFSPGKPDPSFPESKTAGLGTAVSGTRLLALKVADPDGGPDWGIRLVKTSRNATCVQVGRLDYGTLGSLGIDDAWSNDHEFHPMNPIDGPTDFCGATDSAGDGFVSAAWHETASAYTPSDAATSVSYCQITDQFSGLKSLIAHLPKDSRQRRSLENLLRKRQAAQPNSQACPAGSLRMIFAGLLGPDAKSITYTTPSGRTRTERTVGGVGAYLIVVRQSPAACARYGKSLVYTESGCEDNYGGTELPALRLPNAVTSVTYNDGSTCNATTSARFTRLYKESRNLPHKNAAQAQAQFAAFLKRNHLTARQFGAGVQPSCPLKGFVSSHQSRLTTKRVASPITVTHQTSTRWCVPKNVQQPFDGHIIACPNAIPPGDILFNETLKGQAPQMLTLITASFTARQPVTSTNSWYEWQITDPSNRGGQGSRTETNIRAGQRISFSMFLPAAKHGTFRGTVAYVQNIGRNGSQGGDDPSSDGPAVGHFNVTIK